MENQNDLRPNLFQEVAANVQEGKNSRGKNHLSIKQVHTSKQTTLSFCGGCMTKYMRGGVQGLMTIRKQVSLVLLLMEQFALAYKCSRKI